MIINNPKTGEKIENRACSGCMCHELGVQFSNLLDGCCAECGCPKNLAGFEHFKKKLGTVEIFQDAANGLPPATIQSTKGSE